jgi:hypothetical protein
MTKLIVAFRNFAKVPEIRTSGGGQPEYVSFVPGYGLHGRASIRVRDYSGVCHVFTVPAAYAAITQWTSVAHSSVIPHPPPPSKHEGDRLSSAAIKNMWSYMSTPPYMFVA